MKIRREVKTGILVMVTLVLLIWGLNFLKGWNVLSGGNIYYGVYNRVDGLTEGSPIFFKGYKIGTVRDIELDASNKGEFVVAFLITKPIQFTENAIAQIYSLDLMGTKGVQLLVESGNKTLIPGDTLRTSLMGDLIDQVGMEVLPIKDKAERLIVKLDSVLTDIGSVFSQENRKGLDNSIKSLSVSMTNLAEMTDRINQALDENGELGKSLNNLEGFTSSLQKQSANLDVITTNLAGFSTQLNKINLSGIASSADSTIQALNGLVDQATNGDGSLGMLMGDQTLYLNMQDATANLDRLLADIRHNPERYLSFSAVNLGRRVYVDTDETLADEEGIAFKVKIAQSTKPLDIRNSLVLDDKPVYEDFNGKSYIYTVGETRSYTDALKLYDRLHTIFPGAMVISLKDGKPIRLEKALRKIDIKN
jgi:phospholipid/cholesterol/gamma-HCH transport system substrate-binding protein